MADTVKELRRENKALLQEIDRLRHMKMTAEAKISNLRHALEEIMSDDG